MLLHVFENQSAFTHVNDRIIGEGGGGGVGGGRCGGGGGGRKGGGGGKVGATNVLAWPHQHRRRLLASLPVHAKLRLLEMTSKVTQVSEAGTAYGTMLLEDVCTVLQFVKPTLAKAAWTLLCTHVVQSASLVTAWQYP